MVTAESDLKTEGITPLQVTFSPHLNRCQGVVISLPFHNSETKPRMTCPPLPNFVSQLSLTIDFLGLLTKEFLDFSASRGNNLRSIGLEPGCKWCLCTARWREAMEAAKSDNDPVVPKVFLHATDASALENGISLKDLKRFAAEPEAQGGGGSLEKSFPRNPEVAGSIAKETH